MSGIDPIINFSNFLWVYLIQILRKDHCKLGNIWRRKEAIANLHIVSVNYLVLIYDVIVIGNMRPDISEQNRHNSILWLIFTDNESLPIFALLNKGLYIVTIVVLILERNYFAHCGTESERALRVYFGQSGIHFRNDDIWKETHGKYSFIYDHSQVVNMTNLIIYYCTYINCPPK